MNVINKILRKNFSDISKETIQTALIEFYSQRSPQLYDFFKPKININFDLHVIEPPPKPIPIAAQQVSTYSITKFTKDASSQTDDKNDQINEIINEVYNIKDKRKRRSKAWQIYKAECDKRNLNTEIKYPAGDERIYLKLYKKLILRGNESISM